jgi:hypothetical protein
MEVISLAWMMGGWVGIEESFYTGCGMYRGSVVFHVAQLKQFRHPKCSDASFFANAKRKSHDT